MFYIYTEFFFYSGTINKQNNGALRDENGTVLTFESKEDARKFLVSQYGPLLPYKGCQYYNVSYCLSHGEYERPTYKIRKIRTNNNNRRQQCSK